MLCVKVLVTVSVLLQINEMTGKGKSGSGGKVLVRKLFTFSIIQYMHDMRTVSVSMDHVECDCML